MMEGNEEVGFDFDEERALKKAFEESIKKGELFDVLAWKLKREKLRAKLKLPIAVKTLPSEPENKMADNKITTESRTKWYVLEWNALDNDMDLYVWESEKSAPADVWEEIGEGLHNFASVLVMDEERFGNFIGAVDKLLKGRYRGEWRK